MSRAALPAVYRVMRPRSAVPALRCMMLTSVTRRRSLSGRSIGRTMIARSGRWRRNQRPRFGARTRRTR